jgi:Ca2+-binding EF-hand superfamily protein
MTLEERAKDIFGMFDRDNSGEITIGEFKTKLEAFQMGFSIDEVGAIVNELMPDLYKTQESSMESTH